MTMTMSGHSGGEEERRATATRTASFKLGKRGTAGNPAPSWKPNLKRDGTYDSRPQKSIRETRPETFKKLDPEIGSRIFLSGLPKDITDQDLEDLMTSTIGPVHEVYMAYQYLGTPLYRHSAYSGPQRNPEAEVIENMRKLRSTGCGMVHFKREKDAMEAWEKYHGKILDNDSTVLRIQIVIDADETWLLPQTERESNLDMGLSAVGMEHQMALDETGRPLPQSIHPQQISNGAMQVSLGSSSMKQPASPPSSKKTKKTSNTLSTLSLAHRIGPSTSEPSAYLDARITFGGHVILGVDAVVRDNSVKAAKPSGKPANVVVASKGKIKKGPRRMNKIIALQTANLTARPTQTPAHFSHVAAKSKVPSAQDLDDEMELYRKGGLMGLKVMN